MPDDLDADLEDSGGGLARLLMMVIPALLIGLAGGFFIGQSVMEDATLDGMKTDPPASKEPKTMVGGIFALAPFVVNLNEERGNRYLKVTIKLEMDNEKLRPELERRKPQLRDLILSILTAKSSAELQALEGKFRLREEIQSRVNNALVNGSVTRVYLTDFMIQ
ncbi:flagellar basal body-associated FliL family protein [Magnetococcales bacterium HHB-1]